MDPRGRARLCAACDKLVHDLSGRREAEARELLETSSESLCVRYLYDATGKIWFSDELARVVPASRLKRHERGAVAVSVLVAPLLIQACGGADPFPADYNPGYGRPSGYDDRYRPDAAADNADARDPSAEAGAGTDAADAVTDAADAGSDAADAGSDPADAASTD